MQLDTVKVRNLRQEKAWTQQQLADICGLSLRTIQRVELHGTASLETGRSLAAAFEVEYSSLQMANQQPPSDSGKTMPSIWLISASTFAAGVLAGAALVTLTA